MKLGNKIIKIVQIDYEHYKVVLEFSDSFIAEVSLQHIFEKPKGLAREILRGQLFDKCYIDMGALAWPNGLELCPDAIRIWIIEQTKSQAA